jgi:hypothetical protein
MTGGHDVSQPAAGRDRGRRPGDRPHDVSNLTTAGLERARRDLRVSLALAVPGSPARVPVLASLAAIDRELGERARTEDHDPETRR